MIVYEECRRCSEARAAVQKLTNLEDTHGVIIGGSQVIPGRRHPGTSVLIASGTLRVHCAFCEDSGLVLTVDGQRLLSIFLRAVGRATSADGIVAPVEPEDE